jgi:hypothetical protein
MKGANPHVFQSLTGNHKKHACFLFTRNTIRARLNSRRISNMRAIDDDAKPRPLWFSNLFAWLCRFIWIGMSLRPPMSSNDAYRDPFLRAGSTPSSRGPLSTGEDRGGRDFLSAGSWRRAPVPPRSVVSIHAKGLGFPNRTNLVGFGFCCGGFSSRQAPS